MTINKIIQQVNERLANAFKGFAGSIFYPVAETVYRISGTVVEEMPGIVSDEGEITYVGPDDVAPIIGYWKVDQLSTNSTSKQSFGRDEFRYTNVYRCSLILYYDRKRVKIDRDAMYLIVLANASGFAPPDDFRSVLARFGGVNLNSRQVYDREFKGPEFTLPAERCMIEISCTIEGEFDKSCLDKLCC